MPIARLASPGPLRQGDILKDLLFYITSEAGARPSDSPFSVVLSRDCNALRSENVLVAEIQSHQPEIFTKILSGDMSLDQARRAMDVLRDGEGTPNRCYLGPLLDGEQRYAVVLDKIHTVEVPPAGEKRTKWVDSHRVFQLDNDFIRHLQVKFFSSIAKQGFDDFTWWPHQDLEALVRIGRKDVATLASHVQQAELEVQNAQFQKAKPAKLKGLNRAVTKKQAELDHMRGLLALYEQELARRTPE
ncbi:MAG: hypothetical protein Tsb0020_21250 [Haliangiales bacterium]